MKIRIYHKYDKHIDVGLVQRICFDLHIARFKYKVNSHTWTTIEMLDKDELLVEKLSLVFNNFKVWKYDGNLYISVKEHDIVQPREAKCKTQVYSYLQGMIDRLNISNPGLVDETINKNDDVLDLLDMIYDLASKYNLRNK